MSWPSSGDDTIRANPTGLRKVLNWISSHYGSDRLLLIAASGLPDSSDANVLGNTDMLQVKLQYINEALKGSWLIK